MESQPDVLDSPPSAAADPSARLQAAIGITDDLGDSFGDERDRLAALAERLREERFHLAVLGQFKRGKSTLINALLGDELLPTALVPLTAVPTYLRHGVAPEIRLRFRDGRPVERRRLASTAEIRAALEELVTESGNPENKLGLRRVDVLHASPLLAGGLVLIDTPGIASTFRHNTLTTLEILSQCDAAVFVSSVDPPVTEPELEFLRTVCGPLKHLTFVLNKIDYLDEPGLMEARAFLEKVLREQADLDPPPPIFPTSAKHAADAQRSGTSASPVDSGLPRLRKHLIGFLARDKLSVLQDAVERQARDAVGDVRLGLELRLRSLAMPLDDLRDKLATFERELAQIGNQRQAASDHLDGDERRAREFVEKLAEELRGRARAHLGELLDTTVAGLPNGAASDSAIQEAFDSGIPGFFARELSAMAADVERHVQGIMDARATEATELVRAVRETAAGLFDVQVSLPSGGETFSVDTRQYWHFHDWKPSLSPLPEGALDRFLPAGVRFKRLLARWRAQVADLTVRNCEIIRWEILQSLQRAFQRFRTQLGASLEQASSATRRAIDEAVERRAQGEEAAAAELERLRAGLQVVNQWLAESDGATPGSGA